MLGAAAMASAVVFQAFTSAVSRWAPPLGAIALVVLAQVVGPVAVRGPGARGWAGRSRVGETFYAREASHAALVSGGAGNLGRNLN